MNDDTTIPVIWWDEERRTTRSRARRARLMPLTLRLCELEPALITAGIPRETVRELLNEVATLEGFGLAKGYRL